MRRSSFSNVSVSPRQPLTLAEAHALAAKEAETDATKRALSTFGNSFGLALYDRDRKGVRKSKAAQPKPCLWVIRAGDGTVANRFTDPRACARALRQMIDQAVTLNALTDLWRANTALVAELEKHLSAGEGSDADDLDLAGAYQIRYTKFWTKQTLSPVNPEAIDKSRLALPTPKRIRAPEHLKWVGSLGCTVCQRNPADAHHLKRVQPNALARKPGDQWVVPLCRLHHRALHDAGNETQWWDRQKIDPVALAEELWAESSGLITKPVEPQQQPVPGNNVN